MHDAYRLLTVKSLGLFVSLQANREQVASLKNSDSSPNLGAKSSSLPERGARVGIRTAKK